MALVPVAASPPAVTASGFLQEMSCTALSEHSGGRIPTLLRVRGPSGMQEVHAEPYAVCLLAGSGGPWVQQFRVELLLPVPGVHTLSLASDAGGCAAELPIMVCATPAATTEFQQLFFTMLGLVAKEQSTAPHQQHQQLPAAQSVGHMAALAATHTHGAPGSVVERPAASSLAAAGAEHTAASAADAAAALPITMATWTGHYAPLLEDLRTVLGFGAAAAAAPAAVAGTPRGLPHAAAAAAAAVAAGQAGDAALASTLLTSLVEFLGLHNCWVCISFLLAEAFKSGLLANIPLLQPPRPLLGQAPPAATAAAAAASSLVALLAAAPGSPAATAAAAARRHGSSPDAQKPQAGDRAHQGEAQGSAASAAAWPGSSAGSSPRCWRSGAAAAAATLLPLIALAGDGMPAAQAPLLYCSMLTNLLLVLLGVRWLLSQAG